MRVRAGSKLVPTLAIAALVLLVVAPTATYAVDPGKYAGIQDDEPSLPAYASEQDKQMLDAQLEQSKGLAQIMSLVGPPTGTVWTPAEYEPVEGVLIRWGTQNALLTEFAVGVTAASANLCTGSGTPYACCTGSGTGTCDDAVTKVFILVADASMQSSASSTLSGAGADMSRIEFIVYNSDSVWIRDYGPRYVYEDPTRVIIDHEYNRPTRPNDNAFNEHLANLWNERIYNLDIIHGGGNFVATSTGEGFMSTLALDPDEDGTDEYTEAQIIQVFDDYMNVDVTLYQRLPDTIDATGHIDMWMMPVSNNAVMVSEFASGTGKTITDAGAADLTTRGYTVYRPPAWTAGGTHYTYTNAAIVNDKVFIPWYSGYSTENAAALALYQTALPNHTVIQVDTTSIISLAGAIHCVMKHVYTECAAGSLTISGTVEDGGSSPVEGVSLTADNGGGWATTDSAGDYDLCVPPSWTGTVTPAKSDHLFSPPSRSYTNVTTNETGQDYTATLPLELLGPDDFQTDFGSWSNVGGDDFDWTRDSGGTPSSGTGPSVDHTTGTGSGFYAYTEASSPQAQGDTAILQSPCIDLTGAGTASLSLAYHMYGAGMGSLGVQVASSAGASCGALGSYISLFAESGDKGDQWFETSVNLDGYVGGSIQIHVLGTVGSSYQSDMAIDDVVLTASLASVCGDGNLDAGEQCDDGNTSNGDCCSDVCLFESTATVCRASADVCDVAETCDGAGSCPADGFEPSSTECRASADVCDVAETCTGSSAACPADDFEPSSTECRAAADICDVAETCTGSSASCPADGFAPGATPCRAAAGVCDAAETCTGSGPSCPADGKLTSECRAAVDNCDAAEFCDGVADDCPVDVVLNGVPCLDGDVCNGDELCVVGVCTAGGALDCDDLDACTADSCDAISGCINDPIPQCQASVPTLSGPAIVLLGLQMLLVGAVYLGYQRRRMGA